MGDTPRIIPVPDADLTTEQRELLDGVAGAAGAAGAKNIFTTFVRHPGLFRRWLPFGGKLLAGKLPPRDRELLILRTAINCRSEYEWTQHARIGRASGLSSSEIDRIREGPGAWGGFDAVLLRAADELHEESTVSDSTWQALADAYDERQLIEVPMIVGHYHLVAYTLNSLGVQLESDSDG